MRFQRLDRFLVSLGGVVFLALAGCAGEELQAEKPVGERSAASPAAVFSKEITSLGKNLQDLRRGLASQEERIDASRREVQSLTQKLLESAQSQEASLTKIGRSLEELQARVDGLENELAFHRASAAKIGPPSAAGGEPMAESPVGLPAKDASTQVAEVGAPSESVAGLPGSSRADVPPAGAPEEPEGKPSAAARTEAPSPGVPPESPPPPRKQETGPEIDYNEALRTLREERSFPRARLLFHRFMSKYPAHELADDAQYWIGESYFQERNFERAILAFNKVQVDYANGDKAPDALLKEGLSFLSLGDRASARELLGRLIQKYPRSEAAKAARKHLDSL